MTPLHALGLFVALPLLIGFVVYLLVSAPGWIRSSSGAEADEGGPFLVTSGAPLPDPARLPSEMAPADTLVGGGVSARW